MVERPFLSALDGKDVSVHTYPSYGSRQVLRRFTVDDWLLTVMSAIYVGFTLIMILACMEPDAYYFDFYGND